MIRETTADEIRRCAPALVVWELTSACNLKCQHCGSRAGTRRTDELSTAECLEIVDQLARLGIREVGLIGGEAYLRKDWLEIVRAVTAHGMQCVLQTGGRQFTQKRVEEAAKAGLKQIGVSIDGLEPLHDRFRGVNGSYRMALDVLKFAKQAGILTSANTAIGRETLPDLHPLFEVLAEAGIKDWQMQLVAAMGNAVDNDSILMQPYQLLEFMPVLAELFRKGLERGIVVMGGNNVGYFGPYERLWRNLGDERDHWGGCTAGEALIAIEADGSVKGCPALATNGFSGGNVRDMTIEQIWNTRPELHFARTRTLDDLWGYCKTCYFADVCRAGCTWTSHSLFGRTGNNPYCHYRAIDLAKQGLRERVVKRREADVTPFAIGEFDVLLEPFNSGSSVHAHEQRISAPALVQIKSRPPAVKTAPEGRVAPQLVVCRACELYVYPQEVICPHCGANLQLAAEDFRQRQELVASLSRFTSTIPSATPL